MPPRQVAVEFLLAVHSLAAFHLAQGWCRPFAWDYLLMACAHLACICALVHRGVCASCRAPYAVPAAQAGCLFVLGATIIHAFASHVDSRKNGTLAICWCWANAACLLWQAEPIPAEGSDCSGGVPHLAPCVPLLLFYAWSYGDYAPLHMWTAALYITQCCSYLFLLSFLQCGHRLSESGEVLFESLLGAQQALFIGGIVWGAPPSTPPGVYETIWRSASQLGIILLWVRLRVRRHRAPLGPVAPQTGTGV